MNRDESLLSIWNETNRSKEIKTNKERSFIGKANIILTIDAIGTFLNSMDEQIASDLVSNEEIDALVGDPSYQFVLLEDLVSIMDNHWKYKKLGGTWQQTKEEAIKKVEHLLDESLEKIIINSQIYYTIDVDGYEMRTPTKMIGRILGEQIKSCTNYQGFKEVAIKTIIKNIEDDIRPLLENDNIKLENDMRILKHLINKYPNYKELVETITQ